MEDTFKFRKIEISDSCISAGEKTHLFPATLATEAFITENIHHDFGILLKH